MPHIFFGTCKANMEVGAFMVYCPSCETDAFAYILIVGKYFHVYFIPVFPMEKEATIICKRCGLKRYNVPLTARLIKNHEEVKQRFRYPLYMYSLPIALALLIFLAILLP